MPWKDKTVEELRKEFVEAARSCLNFSSLCQEFGITRATGYKWVKRYENDEALTDRSRRPRITANKTSETIENQIKTKDRIPRGPYEGRELGDDQGEKTATERNERKKKAMKGNSAGASY